MAELSFLRITAEAADADADADADAAPSLWRRLQLAASDEGAPYFLGVPAILWVFAMLALAVTCLIVFGRRKLPDFSDEKYPRIVVPASAAASTTLTTTTSNTSMNEGSNSNRELAEEDQPLLGDSSEGGDKATRMDYDSTAARPSTTGGRPSSGGPGFGRQTTNPAGLVAKPQYNPTGLDNWVFGGGNRKK